MNTPRLGLLSRADLVEALAAGDTARVAYIAEQLGLHAERPAIAKETICLPTVSGFAKVSPPEPAAPTPTIQPADLAPVPFWQPITLEQIGDQPPQTALHDSEAPIRWNDRPPPPRFQPLATQCELHPRLHRALSHRHLGKRLDVPQIVRAIGQGRVLRRLPRVARRGWGSRLQLIDDRSDRLIPYWQDHTHLLRWIARRYPGYAMEYGVIYEGLEAPRLLFHNQPSHDYRPPPPGSALILLSDLGALAPPGDPASALWQTLLRRLRAAGHRPLALLPCDPSHLPAALRHQVTALRWERHPSPATHPQQQRQQVERLLDLLSPAVRIEPGLLRAVRLLPEHREMDAAVESAFWQHPDLASNASPAATLHPEAARSRQQRLRRESQAAPSGNAGDDPLHSVASERLQQGLVASLRTWHAPLAAEIWLEEIQHLPPPWRHHLPASEQHLSQRLFRQLSRQGRGAAATAPPAGALPWFRRVEQRLPQAAWEDCEIGPDLQRLSWALHRDQPGYRPAHRLDPHNLELPPDRPLRTLGLQQRGERLEIALHPLASAPTASPIALLRAGESLIQQTWAVEPAPPPPHEAPRSGSSTTLRLDGEAWRAALPLPTLPAGSAPLSARLILQTDCRRLTLAREVKPQWAEAMGRDRFGLWAELLIEPAQPSTPPVRQRLRWIPPGEFWMGSPEGEPERNENEGPQHEVLLSQGFWLFDTPVTQALWQAVMGENPSLFKGEERPVEQVSWEAVQQFLTRIHQIEPTLALRLPSEAEWEYACRAGTETPFWFGDNITTEQVNYDGSKPYASGKKGQYREETVEVKELPCNGWGLYQMHGNVWEWCQDWYGNYSAEPVTDPAGPHTGPGRVLRGGGWSGLGRNCRSADRLAYSHEGRLSGLSFRLAQNHSPATQSENREKPLIKGRYRDHGDGTVTDMKTGLQWMRCAIGQEWREGRCQGEARRMSWEKARALTVSFAGYKDWRLPTREELRSLVYCSSGKPDYFPGDGRGCRGDYQRPTLVEEAFPNTLKGGFWSSSANSLNSSHAWLVHFYYGLDYGSNRSYNRAVRLVRGGQ